MTALLCLIIAVSFVTGCALVNSAKTGQPLTAQAVQADVTNAKAVVTVIQPVASDVACADQAAANATGAILAATGDQAGAASASTASTITGYLCNGLKAGTPIQVPASIAPAIQAIPPASPPKSA